MIRGVTNSSFRALMALALVHFAGDALAQSPITFQGKTITMLIDSAAGGGTDFTARLFSPFLAKHLPGNPIVIPRNMPGAEGTVALNYFVQQVVPDGLTLVTGAGPSIDPIRYRAPQSRFDPGKFEFIGGIDRGGNILVVSAAAEKRFTISRQPPWRLVSPVLRPDPATSWRPGELNFSAGTGSGSLATDRRKP